jgi:hypothetical protein
VRLGKRLSVWDYHSTPVPEKTATFAIAKNAGERRKPRQIAGHFYQNDLPLVLFL